MTNKVRSWLNESTWTTELRTELRTILPNSVESNVHIIQKRDHVETVLNYIDTLQCSRETLSKSHVIIMRDLLEKSVILHSGCLRVAARVDVVRCTTAWHQSRWSRSCVFVQSLSNVITTFTSFSNRIENAIVVALQFLQDSRSGDCAEISMAQQIAWRSRWIRNQYLLRFVPQSFCVKTFIISRMAYWLSLHESKISIHLPV